jgi:hypothetical protein
VPGADGRKRDLDRHPNECTGNTPQHAPEEYRKQHHEGGDRNRSPRNAWLYVAADDELKKVESDDPRSAGTIIGPRLESQKPLKLLISGLDLSKKIWLTVEAVR